MWRAHRELWIPKWSEAFRAAIHDLTGETTFAYRHSGYPGGLRKDTYADLLRKRPERVVEQAVKGMLPKNTLGRKMLSKLKVYAGPDHPHAAQMPVPFEIIQIAQ